MMMTMTSETFPSTVAQRRRVAPTVKRDDSRSHLPGTPAYRPGCIAGWGPRLG